MSCWLHGCCGELDVGPVNQVNHTSWVAVVTPTDRPKSARNCCLIELFCYAVCVVNLPFWHFCWCRGFCHRTWSDLLLFVFNSRYEKIIIWYKDINFLISKNRFLEIKKLRFFSCALFNLQITSKLVTRISQASKNIWKILQVILL